MNSRPVLQIGYQVAHRATMTARGQADFEDGTAWLAVDVEVVAGTFNGVIFDYLGMLDLIRFCEQLNRIYDTLKGYAALATLDDHFSAELQGIGFGLINVVCAVQDGTAKLTFSTEIDQTFLPEMISQATQMIAAWPTP